MSLTCKLAVLLALSASLSCQGAKTTVDFTVRVGADTCSDANVTPPDEDSTVIDCVKASGEGTVRIVFPRTLWYRMKAPRTEGK